MGKIREMLIRVEIAKRKWNRIGLVLRRTDGNEVLETIQWRPEGCIKRANSQGLKIKLTLVELQKDMEIF